MSRSEPFVLDADEPPVLLGAARMLGMKPSTLSSRIKALGIRRPSE